jgi:hypothetical protein
MTPIRAPRRRFLVAVLGAALLAACSSPGSSQPASGSPSPAISLPPSGFSADDLALLVPSADAPPDQTKFSETGAGDNYVPAVLGLPVGEQGYLGGYENVFIPPASTRQPGDPKSDGALVLGGMLFEDEAGATITFTLVAHDFGSRQQAAGGIAPVAALAADVLGTDAFGMQGSFEVLPAFDYVLFAWRVSNVIFYVEAWGAQGVVGSVDPGVILALAAAMDARASS